jgi:hypothetical protein
MGEHRSKADLLRFEQSVDAGKCEALVPVAAPGDLTGNPGAGLGKEPGGRLADIAEDADTLKSEGTRWECPAGGEEGVVGTTGKQIELPSLLVMKAAE